MKMRKIVTLMAAAAMTAAMATTAFAGVRDDGTKGGQQTGWQQDHVTWWWQNEDGSWLAGGWYWLDGDENGVAECYYLDENGYTLLNTTTPDGYQVNDGAWVVDGVVQTKSTAQFVTPPVQNEAQNPAGETSDKNLSDYGYTKGMSDLIYDLPNLSLADAVAMFGEITQQRTQDGFLICSFADRVAFIFNADGSVRTARLPFDIALEGLSCADVAGDAKVTRVVKYLKNFGWEPHEYGYNESFVFRTTANNGATLRITSDSTGGYSERARLSIDIE